MFETVTGGLIATTTAFIVIAFVVTIYTTWKEVK